MERKFRKDAKAVNTAFASFFLNDKKKPIVEHQFFAIFLWHVNCNSKRASEKLVDFKEEYALEHRTLLALLKAEVKPAVGCTEPAAVAMAAGRAASLLGGSIQRINVWVSKNIYKNAMGVMLPNTGEAGLDLAVALGVIIGKPEKELQILELVTEEVLIKAKRFIDDGKVEVGLADNEGVYIRARAEGENGWDEIEIADSHTNIIREIKNGETIFIRDKRAEEPVPQDNSIDVTGYSLKDLIEAIETVPLEDIRFLQEGIEMNMLIAAKGLEIKPGKGLGIGLKQLMDRGLLSKDIANSARIAVAAACDARMAGVNFPVMSSMGSGNHGIEVIIPLAVVAQEINAPTERVLRALALSHLICAFVKQRTGKLTPICGCSIAAGVGVTAAITWLKGGSQIQIEGAIKNVIGNLTGMICDGAKGGCAFKLSTTAGEAVTAAHLALDGLTISCHDGIISFTVEETIRNLGDLCQEGLANTDAAILKIMMQKTCHAS